MNVKPHIKRVHYKGSGRGYWHVSPIPAPKWAHLDEVTRKRFTAAHNFKERMNDDESLRLAYEKRFGKR